jgi:muramoyltetrapeptide carboxypeptidase LdcA involved in peptidoglycan recycling
LYSTTLKEHHTMSTFKLTVGKESGWITFSGPVATTGGGKMQTQEQAQQDRRNRQPATTPETATEEPAS